MKTDVAWDNNRVRRWHLGLDPLVNLHHHLYLPLLLKRFGSAPDLVVQDITAGANAVQVVIANQGDAPVIDPFWVDVYINPDPPPSDVNQIWNFLCDEGIAWGVTESALPLEPGQTFTLRMGVGIEDAYYRADNSLVHWPLPTEPKTKVYAQVDSAHAGTTYGGVLEGHEMRGGAYNNVGGPVDVQAGATGQAPPEGSAPGEGDGGAGRLPPRP
jgi:hypothetical protein